jgi:HEAT repeat protein
MMKYRQSAGLLACVLWSIQLTLAQQPASPSQPAALSAAEASAVMNGWTLLAQGRADQAAATAEKVLTTNPRSAAGLVLALEAELARAGALAALTRYERWLGQRTLEEPAALGRIARGLLQEGAAQSEDPAARTESLRGLAAGGDAGAIAELERAAAAGSWGDALPLAALGNTRGVNVLIEALNKGSGNVMVIAQALGDSKSKAAVTPLIARLEDPKSEVRAMAAQSLGKLGDASAVPRLKALLSDRTAFVRIQAAGALHRLGDDSGQPVLQELMSQTVPSMRLAAADAMSSRPDAAWQALVRELATSQDLEVRAQAARLIAPHDPELARSVLEPLLTNGNPAIRELASDAAIESGPGDLTALRHLMRSNERLTRVRAAARVAGLTR